MALFLFGSGLVLLAVLFLGCLMIRELVTLHRDVHALRDLGRAVGAQARNRSADEVAEILNSAANL